MYISALYDDIIKFWSTLEVPLLSVATVLRVVGEMVENRVAIPNLLLQFIVIDVMRISMIEHVIVVDSVWCDWYANRYWWWWLIVWWLRSARYGRTIRLVFLIRRLWHWHIQSCVRIECVNGRNAVFAMLAKTEHMPNATQNARFLCTLVFAFIQRTLEWSMAIYEAVVVFNGTWTALKKPMLSRSCERN